MWNACIRTLLLAGFALVPTLASASDDLDSLLALPGDEPGSARIGGFVEGAASYLRRIPLHWSKLRVRGWW